MCGRIREYQFGVVEALRHSGVGIDNSYVDGVSLTHRAAERRQYIWTLICCARLTEVSTIAYLRLIALVIQETMIMSLHFMEMITSVRVVYWYSQSRGLMSTYSIPMMSSGMVRTVYIRQHMLSVQQPSIVMTIITLHAYPKKEVIMIMIMEAIYGTPKLIQCKGSILLLHTRLSEC